MIYLALATLYSLTLPLKRTVILADTVVLVAIFVAYSLRVAKAPPEEPDLVGPSAWLATLGPRRRRATYLSFFAVAVLVNLTLNVREAVALTGLFLVQFALAALVPGAGELLALSVVYLVLAAALLRARHGLGLLVRDSLRTPYRQLTAQPDQGPAPGSST